MTFRLLSLSDIKKTITMPEAIDAMETAFLQLARSEVQLPLRTMIPIKEKQAITGAMPAYLQKEDVLGLKVVSIFPENLKKNKPSINGFIVLLNEETGELKALMDAGYLTALRTGAISGLATKYFSSENATHLSLIGAGVQAHTQLEGVTAVRPIKKISVWSLDFESAKNFAKQYEKKYEITPCNSISEAVKDADVICTATGSTESLIFLEDIKPNAHINGIGSHTKAMREIDKGVLSEAVVIVDQVEAALSEAGEIIHAIEERALKKDSLIELGQWLLNKERDYKNRLSVFKSVGLAIQDLSVANMVFRKALSQGLGAELSLF